MSKKITDGIIILHNLTVRMKANISKQLHEKVEEVIDKGMYKEELKNVTKSDETDMVNSGKFNASNCNYCDESMEVDFRKRNLMDQSERELLEKDLRNHKNELCEDKGVVQYIE